MNCEFSVGKEAKHVKDDVVDLEIPPIISEAMGKGKDNMEPPSSNYFEDHPECYFYGMGMNWEILEPNNVASMAKEGADVFFKIFM